MTARSRIESHHSGYTLESTLTLKQLIKRELYKSGNSPPSRMLPVQLRGWRTSNGYDTREKFLKDIPGCK
jgi:hypothetical protein